MKKFFSWFFVIIILLVAVFGYAVFGSATVFDGKYKTFVVAENETNKEALKKILVNEKIIGNALMFEQLGSSFNIWQKVKAGKYKIQHGENVLNIVKMFKNNKQLEIVLVINKLRTPQDLARLIGKNFSTDSATAFSIITNATVLSNINADSNSLLFNIIPNTYNFYYTTPVEKILEKLAVESKKFWDNNDRNNKAKQIGLTPYQVHIIASIVEEETNKDDEKGNVASVYINRLNANMRLEADPTVKFALKDFTLKRIYEKHLQVNSPYNTYKNKGLPPGAICTPSAKTIDAVLNAPQTNFLFFCADTSFNGYHHFTTNYEEHKKYAALYQQVLNELMIKKQNGF